MVAGLTSFENQHTFYDLWNQLIPLRQLLCSRAYPDNWISIDSLEQLQSAKTD